MIYINNKEKIEEIKFNNYENFYVIADFDRTITSGNSASTWAVMANTNSVNDDYSKRRDELFNIYRPIEIDVNMSDEEKYPYMDTWWKKHINLFHEYGLKEDSIKDAINKKSLVYRKGAKEFLKAMNNYNIPIIIMSAGIGNVIEEFLKSENDLYDNIKIVSNFIDFENGIIKGIRGEIIHALNKRNDVIDNGTKEFIKGRNNILVLGDGIADLKMIQEKEKKHSVTVGFLDEKIDECINTYNNYFDIVITNEGGIDELNNILKIY